MASPQRLSDARRSHQFQPEPVGLRGQLRQGLGHLLLWKEVLEEDRPCFLRLIRLLQCVGCQPFPPRSLLWSQSPELPPALIYQEA